jgi:hypothetical protein
MLHSFNGTRKGTVEVKGPWRSENLGGQLTIDSILNRITARRGDPIGRSTLYSDSITYTRRSLLAAYSQGQLSLGNQTTVSCAELKYRRHI